MHTIKTVDGKHPPDTQDNNDATQEGQTDSTAGVNQGVRDNSDSDNNSVVMSDNVASIEQQNNTGNSVSMQESEEQVEGHDNRSHGYNLHGTEKIS